MQEEQLRELIATINQHPPHSDKANKALNKLIILLQGLPEFRNMYASSNPEYLREAWEKTLMWFSQNIRSFESQTSSIRGDLVRWIKGYLKYRIVDAIKAETKKNSKFMSLDVTTYLDINQEITTYLEQVTDQGFLPGTPSNPRILDEIEKQIERDECFRVQKVGFKLKKYIEADPDKKLRSCHPQRYPSCHCQMMVIKQYLKEPPDKLATLSREYRINYQTLNSHWKYKGIPLLRKIAIEIGYK